MMSWPAQIDPLAAKITAMHVPSSFCDMSKLPLMSVRMDHG
jgi:hypothetical protein